MVGSHAIPIAPSIQELVVPSTVGAEIPLLIVETDAKADVMAEQLERQQYLRLPLEPRSLC